MRTLLALALLSFPLCVLAQPKVPPEDDYPPTADSQKQPNVPAGKTFNFPFADSKIFPGTTRTITVYVPAQYKADKPACLYVGLDGLGFNAPIVFDNLIHRNEIPVLIAVGVSPGQVNALDAIGSPRFNRSFEFDSLNDNLARCVLEEILPAVESHKTPDGLPILLSKDPNDRCTGGGSTGGIGAFNLAFQRPDSFRRVFSAIGTYVGMRGGDRYPVLVRKTEPKPIRVFLQDGSNDEWMGGPEVGDWWMSNQTMQRALEFAGYDHAHVFGHGIHSGRHPTQVFPDAMRFLWKEWPKPVNAGESQNLFLKAILQPSETWADAGEMSGRIFADEHGNVLRQHSDFPKIETLAFTNLTGPSVYVTGFAEGDGAGGAKLWLVRSHPGDDGGPRVLDLGLDAPTGVALSPDGAWLAVAENRSNFIYSYRVHPDGTVSDREPFYLLHGPEADAEPARCAQLAFDRDGRLYAATNLGVQVLDRNGRTRAILPLPNKAAAIGVAFGGEKLDTLYVSAGGRLFARKMKSTGMAPNAAPVKLPPWGAG